MTNEERQKLCATLRRMPGMFRHGEDDQAQSDAKPLCKICGGSGYIRYLGRDNSEEVEDCSCRQSDAETKYD